MINRDFRYSEKQERHPALRWLIFVVSSAVISAVIASTSVTSEEDNATSDQIDIDIQSELIAADIASETDLLTRHSFELDIPVPQSGDKELGLIDRSERYNWDSYEIKSGDNLAAVLKRAGVKSYSQQIHEIMNSSKSAKKLRQIYPGDIIELSMRDNGSLEALRYEIDHSNYLMIEREAGKLVAKIHEYDTEVRTAHASGQIESSLYLAAEKAGISQNIIMELAGIFGWDIDFVLDIRKGDRFALIYEELYRNGEKIADGNILTAEFTNNNKVYRAVRYKNPQTNKAEYYDADGKSMRKAFLRSPVKFSRISSKFTTRRYHPVLHKFRSHKGVDYAAKRGTPIRAAGDGKVIFKGWKGGYGRVVIIQHGSKYTTVYAHLNSFNRKIRVGKKVNQGQTIAYVGSSGLATGPHLHYELRVNGVHRNPLTVKLPSAKPVPKRYLADFELMTKPMFAQLDVLTRTQLAFNN